MVDAERARDIGLVNRVVPPDALDAEVDALAKLIASKSPAGHRHRQSAVLPPARDAAQRGLSMAGHAIACDFLGDDGKEGVDAFLGKRAPQWKAR
jgi:enoyl-CoA hydratase/carnithine racemase